ncbi:MAG: hypothetical protein M2R45_05106 [Verrucomicrobia subdivision 3 bacterium]|nr:hypothetical protein [Limisphaerales bacterium]MCS1417761.1 hypothetical protein [Limisphaerales bacterium]
MNKPKPRHRQRSRYEQDMRIKNAPPDALDRNVFGGVKPRTETKRNLGQTNP